MKFSRLFRRELGRHLRGCRRQVIDTYLAGRYSWMNAFSRASREDLSATLDVLVEAIERDDATRYVQYANAYVDDMIDAGVAPIAILAAGDLFERAVTGFLTPDQRALVHGIFALSATRRQAVLYDRVIDLEAQGA